MEQVNVINQMAQYDFTLPMNITITFDEDNNEERTNVNVLNEHMFQNKSNMSNDEALQRQENTGESFNVTRTVHSAPTDLNGKSDSLSTCVRNQQTNIDAHYPSYLFDLLDTVSENLVVVMRHYYNYYFASKKNTISQQELLAQFNNIKYQCFDLSYSAVVSLILPEENNEKFVNELIEKTVSRANKVLQWKFSQRHIRPFYGQLITWVKSKREYIKMLGSMPCSNDGLIKEPLQNSSLQVDVALRSPRTTHSTNGAFDNNAVVLHENNNMHVFTSEDTGRVADTTPEHLMRQIAKDLVNCTKRKGRAKEKESDKNNKPQNTQIPVNNGSHGGCVQQISSSQSNVIQYKALPTQPLPPYSQIRVTSSKTLPNNSFNIYEIQENRSHIIQNYNMPQTNYLHTTGEQQNGLINQSLSPTITDVTSCNPIYSPNGRCCICGRATITRCSKCYNFSYCSILCQERDAGIHKSTCG